MIRPEHPIAIIDIGSNSVRLCVYEPPYIGEDPVFNEKVQCGLGRDLTQTGKLSSEGMVCTLEALLGFRSLVKALQVSEVYILGTAALRDAQDGPDFAEIIRRDTGFIVEIISGEKEAQYSAHSVLAAYPDAHGIVGDLGGGSLELARIADGGVHAPLSLPLGVLRLKAQADLAGYISEHFQTVPEDFHQAHRFYAIGGTWRTLALMRQGHRGENAESLKDKPVPAADMIAFAEQMTKKTAQELIRDYHAETKRAALLPYAAIMLKETLAFFNVQEILFTNTSIREGKLLEILSKS